MTVLADLTWPEAAALPATTILAVPVGSTEQHGPHLPLGTDTEVAVALASALAAGRPGVVVAPALPYGASGEHAGFAGTLSVGHEALEHVVVELVRSADRFAGTVLVSGHGGNAAGLTRAAARLRAEGRRALAWWPSGAALPGGPDDAHAGRAETSAMLALRPAAVRVDRAEAGDTRPLSQLVERLTGQGVKAVSPNGVLGDPSGAEAAEGAALLDAWAADLVAAVLAWAGPDR